MRYTTIIDIEEIPAVSRNLNARLLYLHLALRAGYHDHDRDQVYESLRTMAAAAGMTLSACRHAIKILTQNHLLERKGDVWVVCKFVMTPAITRRPRNRREKELMSMEEGRQAAQAKLDAQLEETRRQRLNGPTPEQIEARERFLKNHGFKNPTEKQ